MHADEYPVLDAHALYARTGTRPALSALRVKVGVSTETFDGLILPTVDRFAEFVQLLPASDAPHAGGLLQAALTAAHGSLDARRGQILPPGAAPEEMGEGVHRWTYAVLLAALLDGVRGPLGACRVAYRRAGTRQQQWWSPLAGSLKAHGACCYRFDAPRTDFFERSGHEDAWLPLVLLPRIVSESTMAWLGADARLVRELVGVLAAEASDSGRILVSLVRRGQRRPLSRKPLVGISSGAHESDRALPMSTPERSGRSPHCIDGMLLASEARSANEATPAMRAETETVVDAMPWASDDASPTFCDPRSATVSDLSAGVAAEAMDDLAGGECATVCGAPPVAVRFMHWLRSGLEDGSIRCNVSRALVHGVPEGMLLASPRVFAAFAMADAGEAQAAMAPAERAARLRMIQRSVLNAGWHVVADKGTNFITYDVIRSGRAVSRLSGIVIEWPERFVATVPAVNPMLIRAPVAQAV